MLQSPISLGICLGLIISFTYALSNQILKRYSTDVTQPPNLNNVVSIIIACVGITSSVDFGYKVITASASDLGVLKNHRLIMAIGAVSIFWVSVGHIIDIFSPIISRISYYQRLSSWFNFAIVFVGTTILLWSHEYWLDLQWLNFHQNRLLIQIMFQLLILFALLNIPLKKYWIVWLGFIVAGLFSILTFVI